MTKVKPSVTDSRITTFNDDQYCYAPTNPIGKLLVALPGSGAKPLSMAPFMEVAQGEGYHVIGLSYPNERGSADCKSVPKPVENYLDNFCREVLFGEKLSTLTDVDVVNCIEQRTLKTLEYLADNFSSEGWGQYLDIYGITYGWVTVAGHSQGGSHALKWAEHRKLQRAIGLSSPREVCPLYKSLWGEFQTHIEDCFFLTHTLDKLPAQDFLIKSMGVTEPYVDTYKITDQTKWGNYLVTSIPVRDSKEAHSCTMTNKALSNEWKHLLK